MDIILSGQHIGELPPLPRDAPVVADILKQIEDDAFRFAAVRYISLEEMRQRYPKQ